MLFCHKIEIPKFKSTSNISVRVATPLPSRILPLRSVDCCEKDATLDSIDLLNCDHNINFMMNFIFPVPVNIPEILLPSNGF